ncbi:hypothetical protein H8E07_11720 [bacterium]|nr:hypothetical protein [bacterium]
MARSVMILILVLGAAGTASAAVLLSADFEGMTVGQPIGVGGAALGEPVDNYNCVSTIRDAPFPSTCLEMDDETDFATGGVTFEFLESAEVTEGIVQISARLWFAEMDGYYVYVREQGSAAESFNTLYFQFDGDIMASDASGSLGSIGLYEIGHAMELRIIHDLDAGTYDIWWDGSPAVEGRAHGIVGRGVGGLLCGIDHDADLDGLFYMDDLLVETGPITPNETATWSSVKSAWR